MRINNCRRLQGYWWRRVRSTTAGIESKETRNRGLARIFEEGSLKSEVWSPWSGMYREEDWRGLHVSMPHSLDRFFCGLCRSPPCSLLSFFWEKEPLIWIKNQEGRWKVGGARKVAWNTGERKRAWRYHRGVEDNAIAKRCCCCSWVTVLGRKAIRKTTPYSLSRSQCPSVWGFQVSGLVLGTSLPPLTFAFVSLDQIKDRNLGIPFRHLIRTKSTWDWWIRVLIWTWGRILTIWPLSSLYLCFNAIYWIQSIHVPLNWFRFLINLWSFKFI